MLEFLDNFITAFLGSGAAFMEFLGNFITVFLGSGAAFGFYKWYSDFRKRKDNVEFLATLLAVQLEGYAIDCAERVSDHDLYDDSAGATGGIIGKISAPPAWPEHEAYKMLDRKLLDEILQFPQECLMADRAAIFWWSVVGDQDCCDNAYRENTIHMGEKAAKLARKLRENYSLPARNLILGEWDLCKFFADEIKKIEARKKKQAAAETEFAKEIFG